MMNPEHTYPTDLDALLNDVAPEEGASLREVWNLAGSEEPITFPTPADSTQALRRLNEALRDRQALSKHAKPAHHADRRPRAHRLATAQMHNWLRSGVVAAAFLLIGALGVLLWQRPLVKTAAPGERLAVLLPDGSTVELNSGSTIRYQRSFGDVRAIALQGEAFFDVEREVRPFIVHTYNAQVRVLGTSFGVRAWPQHQDDGTTVALASGRVALAATTQPDHIVTLTPGQTRRVLLDETGVATIEVITTSVEDATAWRRGDLFFKNQQIGTILQDVERRFSVNLDVAPSIAQKRIDLFLPQPANAEAVVRDVAMALGLRYRATSNGFEVYGE